MNMSARQRIKSPEYHHMICIGKTICTSEKGAYCTLRNETKRNETKLYFAKRNETKRNETVLCETKRNETKPNRAKPNETKPKLVSSAAVFGMSRNAPKLDKRN